MRRFWIHLFLSVLLIVVYVLVVNVISSLNFSSSSSEGRTMQADSGGNVRIGMSDSVSVMVQRSRFYGKIIEFQGAYSTRYLYLFYFMKIPLEVKGDSFILSHIIALLIIIGFNFFLMEWKRKKEDYS